jgi:hypothetical protein
MGMQKCIDFRVDYDIVKFRNNHEEWHDEIWLDDCPATFLPKGANARIHEVKMANGIIRPHHCVRFSALRQRSPPRPK